MRRSSSIRIRAAIAEDLPVLVRLGKQIRDLPVNRRAGCPVADSDAERYRAVLDNPTRRVLLAVDDTDTVLGMAILGVDSIGELADVPAVRLSHLVVDADRRRKGAGRALVDAAAAYAEEVGVDHVITGAAPIARDTNRFLARLGFAPVAVRRVASVSVLRRNLNTIDLTGVPELRGQARWRRGATPRVQVRARVARVKPLGTQS